MYLDIPKGVNGSFIGQALFQFQLIATVDFYLFQL